MIAAVSKPWGRLAATGTSTASLYGLLFGFEEELMASLTRTDGWYPVLPLVTALVFSLSHGAFTAYFWDILGIKPRASVQERSDEAGAD